jgi:hypothetical protein
VVSLGGLVERSIERAVFDGEVGRREFIRRVGASTAASALASVFPVEVAKAFAQDKVGPIERNAEEAKTLAATVGIDVETAMVTTAMPLRTDFPLTTDPFKYRLMELVGVYGDALRDRCQELVWRRDPLRHRLRGEAREEGRAWGAHHRREVPPLQGVLMRSV